MRIRNCRLAASGRVLCFVASLTVFTSTSVWAQVNSWISPTSGNWDNPTLWSLGILPASSQSVMITNSGFKAVAINPSTPINFPASMTVSSLTIQGATNSANTLLLNFFGTAVPLTVLNGLTLQDGAQILDLNSGLAVPGGTLTVTNSQINQDGGFIIATNMSLDNAVYNLTNGNFEAGTLSIGNPVSAQFNQYGGTAIITNVGLASFSGTIPNGISLYGGTLQLPGGMNLIGERGGLSYFQAGGTNQTGQIFIGPDLGGSIPNVTLNGGLLADTGVEIMAGDFGDSTFTQNGGTHVITNGLSMLGDRVTAAIPAIYNLNGGTLSAGSMDLDSSAGGPASFNQTNGTASAGEIQGVSAPFDSFDVSVINLSGGTLACSNMDALDGTEINQSGGALIVTNTLTFAGFIDPGGNIFTNFSTYTLSGGMLIANNISVGGIWVIGDSTTNRITNPGTCTLSNTITIGNAIEQLGRFILAGTSTINLAGSASQLSFANSSGQTWASSVTLLITDWNGNPSGGGAEQLKFGTDQSGLTAAQLNQIQFSIGTNLFPAKILATGEVVPNEGSTNSNPGLVNSWINPASGNWQDATSWSLGILPANNQSVMITNSGFKAVAINASTPINFPASMSVSNLTITSPTNGQNTLLMNFVGAGNPLVIGVNSNNPGSLVIGDTNSAVVMFSSGLIVNDALGTNNSRLGEFQVNGTFTQSDSSEVVAGFLDLNGTYNFTNSQLFVGSQFINGTFNQQGGTNFGEVIFTDGGKYNLFAGVLHGSVDFDAAFGGQFTQSGGTNISGLGLDNPGVYQLSGGLLLPGDISATSELLPSSVGAAEILQTGGTNNAGNIAMGIATYALESGVLTASNLSVGPVSDRHGSFGGVFNQDGGYFNSAGVDIVGVYDIRFGLGASTYQLTGGDLVTPTINMTMGLVDQTGGTNNVGVMTLDTVSSYVLNGGVLIVSNLTQNGQTAFSLVGSIQQSGGTNQVLGTLFVGGSSSYDFTNGLLIADHIQVAGQATFVHAGGSFSGLKNILLAGGSWVERTAGEQLGQLQLGSGTNLNSSLNLPSGSCILRFADSSSVPWAGAERLTIQDWSGSTNGGGSQQVFFGTSASGLTAQQLGQVQFSNPAGLPAGTYSAQILSDGEVVPNQAITASIAFSQQGNNLVLTWPTGWILQSATNAAGPYNDVSSATSPDTINVIAQPQQFFRLRMNE
ncbi:MAG TPA: hypothetical protein VKV04_05175 [Verrucomicrobiae bacterium]|nr:hypothetical protein [Verrucomicrobiae bacterium]